jgi:hypothetical protein
MDALMWMMRQTHHDPMNTSMFDAEAYSQDSFYGDEGEWTKDNR